MQDSEYLVHYGVTGMKWGVWNAETARKRAGGKKPSSAKKVVSDIRKNIEKATGTDAYKIARSSLNIAETALTGKTVATALLGRQAVSSLSLAGIAVASDPVLAGSALAAGLLIGVGGVGVKKLKAARAA